MFPSAGTFTKDQSLAFSFSRTHGCLFSHASGKKTGGKPKPGGSLPPRRTPPKVKAPSSVIGNPFGDAAIATAPPLRSPPVKASPVSRTAPLDEATTTPASVVTQNSAIFAKHDNKAKLLGHNLFRDILVAPPVEDGHKSCYDDDSYKASKSMHGQCEICHSS